MKRIIDISEEDYNYMMECCPDLSDLMNIYEQLKNSTPLNECEAEDKLVNCIDRDYTAKYVEEFANNEYVSQEEAETIYLIADGIRHIPTIYPKSDKPSGKWINDSSVDKDGEILYIGYHCSECGYNVTGSGIYWGSKYCPNCGAKMVEGQGENI